MGPARSDRRRYRRRNGRVAGCGDGLQSTGGGPDRRRGDDAQAVGRASPRLLPRPEVHLEGPGRARLAMELPVGLGDVVGIEDGVGASVIALGKIRLDPFSVDGAIDHDMGDMDVLWI